MYRATDGFVTPYSIRQNARLDVPLLYISSYRDSVVDPVSFRHMAASALSPGLAAVISQS